MTPVGLCIHNTANDASARNEISYMVTNNNQVSFHFAVDDKEIWQGLPLDRNGWHAGDGANGEGNRKHIGIEICYSKSGGERFTQAEEKTVQFVAHLLKERGWGIERVKKHQDFSGKNCPHRTLDMGWQRFLNMVQKHLGGDSMNELSQCVSDRDTNWNVFNKVMDAIGVTADSKDKEGSAEKAVRSIAAIKGNAERSEALEKQLKSIDSAYQSEIAVFQGLLTEKEKIVARLQTEQADIAKPYISQLTAKDKQIASMAEEIRELKLEGVQRSFLDWLFSIFRR